VVGEEDNLLLFYAGHGNRLTTGGAEIGYWLPANAEAPPRNTFWVAKRVRHRPPLADPREADPGRRRLLLCGLLSTEPSFLLVGDNGPQYSNMDFLKFKLGKRSRLLLSSGGDQPVLDEAAAATRFFARAFLDELESNDRLLPSPELFLRVRERVTARARSCRSSRRRSSRPSGSGHEVGDFFFVPVRRALT